MPKVDLAACRLPSFRLRTWPGRPVHDESLPGGLLERTFAPEEIDCVKDGSGQAKDVLASAQARLPGILRLCQQGKSQSEIGRRLGFTHQGIGRPFAQGESHEVRH
jgi:hypothetical protein